MVESGYIKLWLVSGDSRNLLASTREYRIEPLMSVWRDVVANGSSSVYIATLLDGSGEIIDEVFTDGRVAADLLKNIHEGLIKETPPD